ncbi:hypothetical protein F5I97DRAFT_1817993 [Phlebopus sp. FC_14]|nr:hypothetical protein F5I97DRAFT_1817993 [Phlebopus sp. FC_14]
MPALDRPLANSNFTLDASGVAGFFGGEEVIAAIVAIHFFKGQRWLGWYNLPGSYTIARRFGQLANSPFWDRLFPGPYEQPESSFGLDGKPGPKFVASLSGTVISETGYLGHLAMEGCKQREVVVIPGRTTLPVEVSLLDLRDIERVDMSLRQGDLRRALPALMPMITSFVTCTMCALYDDWFCFAMILLGILAGGVTTFVIGSAELSIQSVRPPLGVPPGDGMLIETRTVLVVKGEERHVNVITKGRFSMRLAGFPNHSRIGICSLLLVVQFLLQLLLIPQGSLFGQIMFILSLSVSWAYAYFLSTIPKAEIHKSWLFNCLGNPKIRKFQLGSRTTMTVFVCLLLRDGHDGSTWCPDTILRDFIPNDTRVWRAWRNKVARQLNADYHDSLSHLELDEHDLADLGEMDTKLLQTLLHDATSAFMGYLSHFGR